MRVTFNHLFEEVGLGASDVLDRLSRHRFGQEANEIAGMTRLKCDADFTVSLEAADAGPMSGARIHNDERPQRLVDPDVRRRNDPGEHVVDRRIERTSVDYQLRIVTQDMRRSLCQMRAIGIPATSHHVEKHDTTLNRVNPIARHRAEAAEFRACRA